MTRTGPAVAMLAAALLFWAELWVARSALPRYGGAPLAWNACMCFFQAVLLAGYVLAEVLAPRARWVQLVVLGVLLASALATLPLGVAPIGRLSALPPAVELVAVLAVRVGLLVLALATTTPLVTTWLAREGRAAHRLYAWSNVGSAVGLVAMPFVLEPTLGLTDQAVVWSMLFMLFAALLLAGAASTAPAPVSTPRATSPASPNVGAWFVLSLVPALLLHGATSLATTDLAAMPLVWIGPLGAYLASFVLAFASDAPLRGERALGAISPLLVFALTATSLPNLPLPVALLLPVLALHVLGLFALALLLHRELARRRPPAQDLARFYRWTAAGGLAAGVLCGLAAPWLFTDALDYPLALIVAGALVVHAYPAARRAAWGAAGLVGSVAVAGWSAAVGVDHAVVVAIVLALVALARATLALPRVVCAATVALVLALAGVALGPLAGVIHAERSFFGTSRVVVERKPRVAGEADPPRYAVLLHGSTVHGRQALDPARRAEPLTYFHPSGPAGQAMVELVAPRGEAVREVGVLGLGIGCLAAYATSGQHWTFFELDPVVVRLARDAGHFTYLEDAARRGAHLRYAVGDARLELEREPAGRRYDLLVFDTFTSDAVPIHLLTVEAFASYTDRLAPDGLVLMNLSHRHLDLRPLVAVQAARVGLHGLARREDDVDAGAKRAGKSPSSWVVLARDRARTAPLTRLAGWTELVAPSDLEAWTDDRASVLPLIVRGVRDD